MEGYAKETVIKFQSKCAAASGSHALFCLRVAQKNAGGWRNWSAGLIHEQKCAGIMVTHDLRMCKFVDRVLQLQDGKLVRMYTGQKEVMDLVKGNRK